MNRFSDEEIEKLKVLLEMVEPLQELVNKDKVSIPSIQSKEVEQRAFRVDKDILKKWDKFVKKNKSYKVQQLVSLALSEFIEKYK